VASRPVIAIAFPAPGQVELTEVAHKPVGRDHVAGETVVTLISPGTELAYYTDKNLLARVTCERMDGKVFIPGYSAVFRVDEIGRDVTSFEIGQLVYSMGDHRSRQCHPANMVLPVPEGLDPAEAAFARIAGIGIATLVMTSARPPGPVVVFGLGIVGNLAAQVFQLAGYTVTATDLAESRVALARLCGVHDAHVELAESQVSSPKLVVECSGHEDAILQACQLADYGGEVALVGVPWRQTSATSAHEMLEAIYRRSLRLRGGSEWALPVLDAPFSTGSILGSHAQAMRWLRNRKLEVRSLATPFRPEEAHAAYESLLCSSEPLTHVLRWDKCASEPV